MRNLNAGHEASGGGRFIAPSMGPGEALSCVLISVEQANIEIARRIKEMKPLAGRLAFHLPRK